MVPVGALTDHLGRRAPGPPQPHPTKPEDIMADHGFTTTTTAANRMNPLTVARHRRIAAGLPTVPVALALI
jgi:hypothetical protein